jgi:hypothetical protein
MKTIKNNLNYYTLKLLPVLALVMVGLALASNDMVSANAAGEIQDGVDAVNVGGGGDLEDIIQNVINIMLFLVGATAVIMLIVGGFRYVTSNGDSSAITSAKNTILYSIVGIVVALAAFAIVNFVLDAF